MNLSEIQQAFQNQPDLQAAMQANGWAWNPDMPGWGKRDSEGQWIYGDSTDAQLAADISRWQQMQNPQDYLRLVGGAGNASAGGGEYTDLRAYGGGGAAPWQTDPTVTVGGRTDQNWSSMTPAQIAAIVNPGGHLIPAGDPNNPFGFDIWDRTGPSQLVSDNTGMDAMDKLGMYLTSAIAGFGGLANAGAFSGLDIGLPGLPSLSPSYWSALADAGTGVASDAPAAGAGTFGSIPPPTPTSWESLINSLITPSPTTAATTGLSGLSQFLQQSGGADQLFGSIPDSISFPDLPANFTLPQSITPEVFQSFPASIKSLFQAAASGGLTASDATSLISRLINGGATAADYTKLLGTLGATGLGVLGANNQQNALSGVADKYLALGAPYRDKLLQSYQPGFDLASQDPAYQGALDQTSNSVLRKLSTSGNPYDSPGALMEANKYVAQNTALPQLNTYRSQLGGFGQLGVNTAGTASTAGAQASGGVYDALGAGLAGLTQPTNDLTSLLKQLKQYGIGTGATFAG